MGDHRKDSRIQTDRSDRSHCARALILIGARDDDLCKIEGYEKLYERAREPKKLVVLPITHHEIYGGKWLDESARLACKWFERFLK